MSENFIYRGYVSNEICDKLIDFFQKTDKKEEGVIGADHRVDKSIKESIDVDLRCNRELYSEYTKELQIVTNNYISIYPSCNFYAPFGTGLINLQYYPPGGGFKIWHTERESKNAPFSHRHLVFMTYLNDVTDGGGTEFLNQNVKFDAIKGVTLIWPADWTHTHRGIISPTQEKYIVTGWFHFL